MKPQVAPLGTRALCLRIECTTGAIIRVTRYPRDLIMSNGQVYQTGSGFDFTGYAAGSSFSPSAIDLDGILGFAGITRPAVAAGEFDNARCYLFAVDFLAPVEDYEPIVASVLGKSTVVDAGYRFEEMTLVDALNQSVGWTYTPTCRHVFGGQNYAGCGVDLALVSVTGTLTAAYSKNIVRDAARTNPDDWFAYGTIKFTSGANAGQPPREIKRYEVDGTVEIFEPFYYAPAVGDAYVMLPGCRKRMVEDCKTKWANAVNFGGFSNIPTSSAYMQRGTK